MECHGVDQADFSFFKTEGLSFDFHFQMSFRNIADFDIIRIITYDLVVKVKMDRLAVVEQKIRERLVVEFHKGNADILCKLMKILSFCDDRGKAGVDPAFF